MAWWQRIAQLRALNAAAATLPESPRTFGTSSTASVPQHPPDYSQAQTERYWAKSRNTWWNCLVGRYPPGMPPVAPVTAVLAYFQAFQRTYLDELHRIPKDSQNRLGHLPLVQNGHAVAYVGRRNGVGFEWRPEPGPDRVRIGDLTPASMMFPGGRDWDQRRSALTVAGLARRDRGRR